MKIDLYILYLYALMEKSHIYNNITVCVYTCTKFI